MTSPVFAGYVGLVLFSAATVAIGLLVTALTESQAIAFFITFFVLMTLWFLADVAAYMQGTVGDVLQYLSFQTRLDGVRQWAHRHTRRRVFLERDGPRPCGGVPRARAQKVGVRDGDRATAA